LILFLNLLKFKKKTLIETCFFFRKLHSFAAKRYGNYIWTPKYGIIGKLTSDGVVHAFGEWKCCEMRGRQTICDTCQHIRKIIKSSLSNWKAPGRHYPLSYLSPVRKAFLFQIF
jgi:hypothetical protein